MFFKPSGRLLILGNLLGDYSPESLGQFMHEATSPVTRTRTGVWAIGDITDVRETKRADAARAHARVVAANIRSLIGGGSADAVYAPRPEHVVLPLGPEGGASQILRDGEHAVVGPKETSLIEIGRASCRERV